MTEASKIIRRKNQSRMEIIREASAVTCTEGYEGQRLECAKEVLINKKIHPVVFTTAMNQLLECGRGKFRNLLLVGPTNCGKSFLLKPLGLLFNTFSNPASDNMHGLELIAPKLFGSTTLDGQESALNGKAFCCYSKEIG